MLSSLIYRQSRKVVALSGHVTYLYDGICISASASLIITDVYTQDDV